MARFEPVPSIYDSRLRGYLLDYWAAGGVDVRPFINSNLSQNSIESATFSLVTASFVRTVEHKGTGGGVR